MKVDISRLSNGLTIATHTMPHLESVALGIWVKAGSRNERPEQHGIAHLLEHMAFKGTEERTAFEISAAIENVGGEINAATSIETTGYFARILEKDLPLAVDILSSIIKNSVFDEEELEREKKVVIQEIGAAHDTPDDVVFDYFTQKAFDNQIIGRPILGTEASVRSFSATDLKNFMKEHYTADNMIIVAAGAVKHSVLYKEVEKYLADLPASPKKTFMPPAHYVGGFSKEERKLMDTQVLLGFKGQAYHTIHYYSAQLLSIVLGGGMSSRLFQEVREKRGLCYSIYAFHWGFSDVGLFGVQASTHPQSLHTLLPVILEELHRSTDRIDAFDIKRAKAQYHANLIMTYESPTTRAHTIARQLLLQGKIIPNTEIKAYIENVDEQTLKKTAQAMFLETKPTLAAVGELEKLTPYETLEQLLAQ